MTPKKAVYKVILLPLCKYCAPWLIHEHACMIWQYHHDHHLLEVYCTMIGNSMEIIIGITMKILLHI